VATAGLAGLAVLHIVYAFILTAQNRKARGENRYEVTARNSKVEWASQNMLVLGIIVVLGLLLHLFNFWYNMMFAELLHEPWLGGLYATDGYGYIMQTFANPIYVVLYIVWLAALWFHLTHGFWSALQTLGWNGKTWFCRWKVIGIAYTTLLILGFLVVVLWFAAKAWCCGACC
jgi:succinate dehydrogenase / fumarate reductase cytochrome b subunit